MAGRGNLGNGIPAPHVGSVDDRGARVDDSEDEDNMEEYIPTTQVQHHPMYALCTFHSHDASQSPSWTIVCLHVSL